MPKIKVIFGDCRDMHEVPEESIALVVTSPPYYNAPFDYPGLFKSYDDFLGLLRDWAKELNRVMMLGRIVAIVTDDMLVDHKKYPVVADTTKIMVEAGFKYRDKIVWRKPEGYIRISRRSGVVLQHPYPMYFYPDNIQESILLFQKGDFDYRQIKRIPPDILERSKINTKILQGEKWYLTVWDITNVLPINNRIEKGVAAFPEEIPRRLITLFSFYGETVLDPFLGSGTTLKVAKELGRNGIGYEIDLELKEKILEKLNKKQKTLTGDLEIEVVERKDALRLRTELDSRIRAK
ncbi:MAG: site-specific DNA-methyltransferase [Candidatus Methanomethylicaceae archaeon]